MRQRKCDKEQMEASIEEKEQQESFQCASKLMNRLVRCPQGPLTATLSSMTPNTEI